MQILIWLTSILGFTYKINDGVYVTGSYNWTDSDSDLLVGRMTVIVYR